MERPVKVMEKSADEIIEFLDEHRQSHLKYCNVMCISYKLEREKVISTAQKQQIDSCKTKAEANELFHQFLCDDPAPEILKGAAEVLKNAPETTNMNKKCAEVIEEFLGINQLLKRTHPPSPSGTHPPSPSGTHPPSPSGTHSPSLSGTHSPSPSGTHPPTPSGTHPPTPSGTHPPSVAGQSGITLCQPNKRKLFEAFEQIDSHVESHEVREIHRKIMIQLSNLLNEITQKDFQCIRSSLHSGYEWILGITYSLDDIPDTAKELQTFIADWTTPLDVRVIEYTEEAIEDKRKKKTLVEALKKQKKELKSFSEKSLKYLKEQGVELAKGKVSLNPEEYLLSELHKLRHQLKKLKVDSDLLEEFI